MTLGSSLTVCTLFDSTAQSNLPEFHCNSIVSKYPSLQGDLEMNEIHTASAISQILGWLGAPNPHNNLHQILLAPVKEKHVIFPALWCLQSLKMVVGVEKFP